MSKNYQLFPHGTSGKEGRNSYYPQMSCDHLRNTVLKLLSFFLAHSERKRLRKPSKRLLEYAEEYDQLFAPKKKSKKGQEQLQKVGEGQCALCGYFFRALVCVYLCSWWLSVLAVCSANAGWMFSPTYFTMPGEFCGEVWLWRRRSCTRQS